jgi:DNA-3-methyladenine glycosylase
MGMHKPLPKSFFARDVVTVARELIGVSLYVDGVGGIIVETEAYRHDDPASHSYRGPKPRNLAMFGPVGHAYVYISHGLHWCLNFVAGEEPGAAVLIRALQPLSGIEQMQCRRGMDVEKLLCAGPGRLTQALNIHRDHDGLSLLDMPFQLTHDATVKDIVVGKRIGITKAIDNPWRFGLKDSKYVSRPFPKTPIPKP